MRHTYAKLIALLLMLTMLLTGCNLVKVDQMKVLEKQREELEKEMSVVLAEYDGGKVTLFDALGTFYSNYSYYAQMYSSFGMELTDEDIVSLQEEAVEAEVINRAIEKEFKARGLTIEQTAEEIQAQVDLDYADAVSYYLDYVEGETDEEKQMAAEMALYSEGFSPESLYRSYEMQYMAEALQAATDAEVTEVTEEELKAVYDGRVEADEADYSSNPYYFESDMSSGTYTPAWIPEGYRTVKHVLVIPEETVLQAVTDARNALKTAQNELADLEASLEDVADEEETAGIQADIDAKSAEIPALEAAVADAEAACLASVQEKTDLIYADFAAGKTIDEIMAAYGEDPGMQSEPAMTEGYYVCADSTMWDANFTAGSMALAQVGDYSAEPVISSSGVHIIYYNSDVVSGPVPMESIADALTEEALTNKRNDHFAEILTGVLDELKPVYHFENWNLE